MSGETFVVANARGNSPRGLVYALVRFGERRNSVFSKPYVLYTQRVSYVTRLRF